MHNEQKAMSHWWTLAEKQSISMILCSIQNKSSSPFLSLEYVLSMFLSFGHLLASRSYKKVLI